MCLKLSGNGIIKNIERIFVKIIIFLNGVIKSLLEDLLNYMLLNDDSITGFVHES